MAAFFLVTLYTAQRAGESVEAARAGPASLPRCATAVRRSPSEGGEDALRRRANPRGWRCRSSAARWGWRARRRWSSRRSWCCCTTGRSSSGSFREALRQRWRYYAGAVRDVAHPRRVAVVVTTRRLRGLCRRVGVAVDIPPQPVGDDRPLPAAGDLATRSRARLR